MGVIGGIVGATLYIQWNSNNLIRIETGSMEPTLNIGDVVMMEKVSGEEIFADPVNGDIIVFYPRTQNPDYLVVHRAIEKFFEEGEWIFRTKGDANTSQDPWHISEKQVVGKVNKK